MVKRLDSVSAIEMGSPHDFLASDQVNALIYGGTLEDIDRHR